MLASLGFVGACSEDFLEREIYGRLPVEDFYQTDEDAFQATIAVYDILQASQFSNVGSGWVSPYLMKSVLSDEANAGSSSGDQPPIQELDDYNFDAQNPLVRNAWRMNYFGIYRANLVVNRVEPTNEYRERLIAEARALRGYYYFDLVSLYGDVPLVLTELTPSEYTTQERAPQERVYDQLEADLRAAIEVLPAKSELDMNFRFSRGTAQAILGKAYLYQEQWDSAAYFFDQVIQSGEYRLENSYSQVWSKEGEFGPEAVMVVPYSSGQRYDWGNFPWGNPRGVESNIHIQLMGPRIDFYRQAPEDTLAPGWGFNIPTRKVYNVFEAAGDEVRKRETLMSVEELRAMGGDWTNPDAHDFEGVIRRKYGTYTPQTASEGGAVPDLNWNTAWRIIRFADVLLMAAEAHYQLGNEAQAREYLNRVRERAELDEVTAGGNELFEAIVRERQLELAFEGHRYQDLVRWGRAAEEIQGFQAGKHELLPIPDIDVRTGNLVQNPGY